MARSLMPDVQAVARNALSKVTGGYASEDEKEDKEKGRAVAKQKTGPKSARTKGQESRTARRSAEAKDKKLEQSRKKPPSEKTHSNVAVAKVGKSGTADAHKLGHGTAPTHKKMTHGTTPAKSASPGKGGGKGGKG